MVFLAVSKKTRKGRTGRELPGLGDWPEMGKPQNSSRECSRGCSQKSGCSGKCSRRSFSCCFPSWTPPAAPSRALPSAPRFRGAPPQAFSGAFWGGFRISGQSPRPGSSLPWSSAGCKGREYPTAGNSDQIVYVYVALSSLIFFFLVPPNPAKKIVQNQMWMSLTI